MNLWRFSNLHSHQIQVVKEYLDSTSLISSEEIFNDCEIFVHELNKTSSYLQLLQVSYRNF